jgi:hypothetical protein
MKLDRPVNEADFYYAGRNSTEPKPLARNGETVLV